MPLPLQDLLKKAGVRLAAHLGGAGDPLRDTGRRDGTAGRTDEPSPWSLTALTGRLVELSGSGATASLTVAAALIHEAQQRGELCTWISAGHAGQEASTFFPPDLAQCGIDLAALPVVRVAGGMEAARATDVLLRSGALALVVLDLGMQSHRKQCIASAIQSRLAGLAHKHGTVVLCLTRKENNTASLGSLVSVRVQAVRQRTALDRFAWELRVLKDKRRGPGWQHVEVCRGPEGLC